MLILLNSATIKLKPIKIINSFRNKPPTKQATQNRPNKRHA